MEGLQRPHQSDIVWRMARSSSAMPSPTLHRFGLAEDGPVLI